MSEIINKNKYLDFDGLQKYDELIKGFIKTTNDALIGGAPESFNTLKEIADWIDVNNPTISTLVSDVSALKAIDHNAYVSADTTLKNYIDGQLKLKQDVISDLETIRSGAALGATALQEVPAVYVTEDELDGMDYTTTSEVESLINSGVIAATASDSDIDNIFNEI